MSPLLLAVGLAGPRDAPVPMTWAWPPDLERQVRVDVVERVTAGGEERRRCFSVTARLRVESVLTGSRISFTDEAEVVPGDACARSVELRPPLPAPFVVDASGALVNVEGDDAATRRTREWWNRTVGYWAGASWSPREARVETTSRALPSLGWEPVPVSVRAAVEEVGCRGRCVTLALDLDPPAEHVTRWFTRLQATSPGLGGVVGSADLVEHVQVETAPDTLVPTRRVERLEVELVMADPPGRASRVVEQTWTFEAGAAPPGE